VPARRRDCPQWGLRKIEILAVLPVGHLVGRIARLGAAARDLGLLDGDEVVDERIAEAGAEAGILAQRVDRLGERTMAPRLSRPQIAWISAIERCCRRFPSARPQL